MQMHRRNMTVLGLLVITITVVLASVACEAQSEWKLAFNVDAPQMPCAGTPAKTRFLGGTLPAGSYIYSIIQMDDVLMLNGRTSCYPVGAVQVDIPLYVLSTDGGKTWSPSKFSAEQGGNSGTPQALGGRLFLA